MSLHPYLFFTNTAREAMTRYHEILGGQLDIMSAADLPAGEETPFETADDFVVHAALMLAGDALLMASDDPTGDGSGVKGAAINLTLDDADDAGASSTRSPTTDRSRCRWTRPSGRRCSGRASTGSGSPGWST